MIFLLKFVKVKVVKKIKIYRFYRNLALQLFTKTFTHVQKYIHFISNDSAYPFRL